MKKISDLFEASVLWLSFLIFGALSPQKASALGGIIGRTIGPRLAASRKARKNIELSFPDWSDKQLDQTIVEMWDNLGRVIAEYPHLKKIILEHTDVSGEEHLAGIGKDSSFLLMGGHIANWELAHAYFNLRAGSPMASVFREPNNPYAARLLQSCRDGGEKGAYIAKSSSGARKMMKVLQQGGRLGILIDQKYNQGIPVDFLGRPAMTSTAIASMALRFKRPILPVQIVRNGSRFHITLHPPYDVTGKDENTIMHDLNAMLGGWVREHPGQWLWLHRRWDSKALT